MGHGPAAGEQATTNQQGTAPTGAGSVKGVAEKVEQDLLARRLHAAKRGLHVGRDLRQAAGTGGAEERFRKGCTEESRGRLSSGEASLKQIGLCSPAQPRAGPLRLPTETIQVQPSPHLCVLAQLGQRVQHQHHGVEDARHLQGARQGSGGSGRGWLQRQGCGRERIDKTSRHPLARPHFSANHNIAARKKTTVPPPAYTCR